MRVNELEALYSLTDRLYHATSRAEIFEAALDAMTNALADRASILLFDRDEVMQFVAWRGLSDDYCRRLAGHTPWTPRDELPAPIFVEDIEQTNEPLHVKKSIRAENIRALGFIPLVAQKRVIGKFMIYHSERHEFSPAESSFALNVARQLGFAIERLRTEESLKESEERFRLMSEEAPVMLWMSDDKGGCLHLNRLLREFWGVSPETLGDFDWRTTMHPDDADAIVSAMINALSKQEPVEIVGRYKNATGATRILSTFARPRFSAGGEFLGMIGANSDVTERYEAEKALRQSEERLAIATEGGAIGIWDWDLQSGSMIYSDLAKAISGLPLDREVNFEDVRKTVHPEDYPGTSALARRALDPDIRDQLPYEYRVMGPDGTVRWVLANGRATFQDINGETKAVRYVGTLQDITGRKQLEERERSAAQRLRLAVSAAQLAVWEVDLRSDALVGSPELYRLLGFPEGEVPTLDEIQAGYPPGERERIAKVAHDAFARGEHQLELDFQYVTPAGESKWLLLRCEIQFAAGLPSRAVGVVADITARKKHEEQTQLLLRELLHRTNNMLAVVQALASQTLRTSTDLESFRDGFSARLQSLSASNRLLVDSNFMGSALFDLVKRQLAPFVGENIDQLVLAGENIVLRPEAVANLGLAFHELATNATKYGALTSGSGQIHLSCRLVGEQVQLEWAEIGGPPPRDTGRKGFGRYVIETLAARAADGSAVFELGPEGVRWRLFFKVEGVAGSLTDCSSSPGQ